MFAKQYMTAFSSSTTTIPQIASTPRHIAIIMDGNGRWATQQRLPRVAGHNRGLDIVRKTVEHCAQRGVQYLTLFAFSSENWRRPKDEISFLMKLFILALEREVNKLFANNIRLKIIGDLSSFDQRIQDLVAHAEKKTAFNTGLTLTIAANYGGRWDILQAMQHLFKAQLSNPDQVIDEASLTQYLAMNYAPEPDLFIRTGGEQRISNFLLWQLAYTELYFTPIYWPDFDAHELDRAIESYALRERRFGQISAQLDS